MNASEKFQLLDSMIEVHQMKESCHILIDNLFFTARRKVMRGLEEHLSRINGEKDHDYTKTCVYSIVTKVNQKELFVKFEGEWVSFGSELTI